jgi:hypothetical protein
VILVALVDYRDKNEEAIFHYTPVASQPLWLIPY